MMRLQINHTWGQLGMQTTPGRFEIKSPGYTLDIQTTLPRVKVEGTVPRIRIDQSRCFAESGLKKPLALTAENAQYSASEMLKNIGRIVEQGNAMADVHKSPNAIADQAMYNAFGQFERDYNMVTMPTSRPDIQVIEGQLDIQVTKGAVQNNTQIRRTDLNYVRGAVNVYLKQRNQLDMRFVDIKV